MFNNSSYMTDYAQKTQQAPIRIKRNMGPSSIAPNPDIKMECKSSYNSSFDKKNTRPAQSIKPPPPQGLGWQNTGKGAKDSTTEEKGLNSVSMSCYRPYTAGEVQASQRHPIIISPEYGAIDINPDTKPEMTFQTTVQKNFVKHEGSFRPAPAPGAMKTPAHVSICCSSFFAIRFAKDFFAKNHIFSNFFASFICTNNSQISPLPK